MNRMEITNFPKLSYGPEEALNRLRVNLGFSGSKYRTILVSSSVPDEGKSFVSFCLWKLLAETGKKTILIDGDLRKSNLRTEYGIRFSDGNQNAAASIVHYLSGQCELGDAICETNIENGYLIPTINTVANPALLFQNERFGQMIDELRKTFEYILVDTPPLVNVSDGNLIATHMDGALLVVRAGSTPRKIVRNSISQIQLSGCDLIGVVLNQVKETKNAYYYRYSKYGYYSDYSKKTK